MSWRFDIRWVVVRGMAVRSSVDKKQVPVWSKPFGRGSWQYAIGSLKLANVVWALFKIKLVREE